MAIPITQSPNHPITARLASIRELPASILLAIAFAWLATKPAFRSTENLGQVAHDAGLIAILACGEALVILTGGVDLSVGSMAALAACPAGALMMAGWAWPLAAIVGLLAGSLGGIVNGALVTYRRFPPILTTLATLLIYRSATNVWTGAAPYNQLPDAFNRWGRGFTPFWIAIVVTAIFAWLLARARFGRRLVAVGGSEQAARLSGVPVDGVLRRVYWISGLCAALAGLLMAGGSNNAQWRLAEGWELDVIGAVVIGGVRLTGGQGSVIGAALGAVIVVVMRNALLLNGTQPEFYGLIIGGVIVLAALAEQIRTARQESVA